MSENLKSKELPYAVTARQQTIDNTTKWDAIKNDAESILYSACAGIHRAIEERQFSYQLHICDRDESADKKPALDYVIEKLTAKGYDMAIVSGTRGDSRAICGGEDYESYNVDTLDLRISWAGPE